MGTCPAGQPCDDYIDGMGLCLPSAPSDGTTASAEPGCGGDSCFCEATVCAEMPHCCDGAFDGRCHESYMEGDQGRERSFHLDSYGLMGKRIGRLSVATDTRVRDGSAHGSYSSSADGP